MLMMVTLLLKVDMILADVCYYAVFIITCDTRISKVFADLWHHVETEWKKVLKYPEINLSRLLELSIDLYPTRDIG